MDKKTFIAILLLSSLSVSSTLATQRMARIIGGTPANSTAWPWMAGLVTKQSSTIAGVFCGASLVAKDWVLTAAHCVIDSNSNSFDVIINHAKLNGSTGERLTVDQIIIHPLYDDFDLTNDLALLKLSTPSTNTPIQILAPFTFQDNTGKAALALGWGTTSTTSEQNPTELHQVDLPIIDNLRCDKAMGDITDEMLCAGEGLGFKDTCFGDSGGPLIVFDTESGSWRQAGITSWGFDCAEPGFFGVYTRLKKYASFISNHICSANELPPAATLALELQGNRVDLNWSTSDATSGYRLNYAAYPQAPTIYSVDINQSTSLSIQLGTGSAFYAAITSYKGNCLSGYSNIEHFVIK